MSLECIRKNPEQFRIFLKDVITNISVVTSTTKTDTVFESECRLVEIFIQDHFKDLLTNLIDAMWDRYDITTKMMHLHELEKQSPPDYIAWRPTSGIVPIATLKGNHLMNLKIKLGVKINNSTKKINILKESLWYKLDVLEKSEKTISKNHKLLRQIHSDYEKITKYDE